MVQNCRDPIGGGEDSCTGGLPPSTHIVFPQPLDDTNTGMRKRPILALNASGNQTHVSLEIGESGWAHHFSGESFLHSANIHCYANACATHYPQTTIETPVCLSSPSVCQSPERTVFQTSATVDLVDQNDGTLLEALCGGGEPPRYMVAKVRSPSYDEETP